MSTRCLAFPEPLTTQANEQSSTTDRAGFPTGVDRGAPACRPRLRLYRRPSARCEVRPTGAGRTVKRDCEAEVVRKAQRGDGAAWETLVRHYSPQVYASCYHFVGKTEDAQDLAQETFLRVFRNLRYFNVRVGSFRTWLARITRNLLIDDYRRRRSLRLVSTNEPAEGSDEEFGDRLVGPTPCPQTELETKERVRMLRRALSLISSDLREVVVLRDLEQLSYQEIAAIMRIPEGTVKSRINRGRIALAKCWRSLSASRHSDTRAGSGGPFPTSS